MLLKSVPEEPYCLQSEKHSPARSVANLICYRCGMFLGVAGESKLGTLLDY
ncbi:MAG: hypothetical protein JRN51_08095 [Nitrososphaerota archaeon]|nr:hypothetical protein [Nitrososphaerota archaeon]